MLTPPASGLTDPMVLSTMTDDFVDTVLAANAQGGSGAFPSAALVMFYPVRLSRPRTYVRAWWLNGATAAGNVDVGIYTISGTTATKIAASTATAQAGVSDIQVVTFPTTTVGPGLYYLALGASLSTATFYRPSAQIFQARAAGCFQTASGHPQTGSTLTVAVNTSGAILNFGLAERTTI